MFGSWLVALFGWRGLVSWLRCEEYPWRDGYFLLEVVLFSKYMWIFWNLMNVNKMKVTKCLKWSVWGTGVGNDSIGRLGPKSWLWPQLIRKSQLDIKRMGLKHLIFYYHPLWLTPNPPTLTLKNNPCLSTLNPLTVIPAPKMTYYNSLKLTSPSGNSLLI